MPGKFWSSQAVSDILSSGRSWYPESLSIVPGRPETCSELLAKLRHSRGVVRTVQRMLSLPYSLLFRMYLSSLPITLFSTKPPSQSKQNAPPFWLCRANFIAKRAGRFRTFRLLLANWRSGIRSDHARLDSFHHCRQRHRDGAAEVLVAVEHFLRQRHNDAGAVQVAVLRLLHYREDERRDQELVAQGGRLVIHPDFHVTQGRGTQFHFRGSAGGILVVVIAEPAAPGDLEDAAGVSLVLVSGSVVALRGELPEARNTLHADVHVHAEPRGIAALVKDILAVDTKRVDDGNHVRDIHEGLVCSEFIVAAPIILHDGRAVVVCRDIVLGEKGGSNRDDFLVRWDVADVEAVLLKTNIVLAKPVRRLPLLPVLAHRDRTLLHIDIDCVTEVPILEHAEGLELHVVERLQVQGAKVEAP